MCGQVTADDDGGMGEERELVSEPLKRKFKTIALKSYLFYVWNRLGWRKHANSGCAHSKLVGSNAVAKLRHSVEGFVGLLFEIGEWKL